MGFPFNLFSIDWAAHKDALGNDATIVPEWLAALCDDLPLVREEGFEQLEDHLVSSEGVAPITPFVVEPLLNLIEAERAKGRALATMLLANVALRALGAPGKAATEVLEQLQGERHSLETLTTRHDASTPFGASLRALIAVIGSRIAAPQFVEQLSAVEALVLEADAKDEAPVPTAAQLGEWLAQVKSGEGHALGLAQRAFSVDPAQALKILEADSKPGTTAVQQVNRVVLLSRCREALGRPIAASGTWSRSAQALLLDAARRNCVKAPKVGAALLALVTDASHAVRRRAVAIEVTHAEGDVEGAWTLADSLARQWLEPSRAGGVNQSLERSEILELLALFEASRAAARVAAVRAAPTPEVALPEGDSL